MGLLNRIRRDGVGYQFAADTRLHRAADGIARDMCSGVCPGRIDECDVVERIENEGYALGSPLHVVGWGPYSSESGNPVDAVDEWIIDSPYFWFHNIYRDLTDIGVGVWRCRGTGMWHFVVIMAYPEVEKRQYEYYLEE
jgi:hypothetical protein